jgi:hypothetical protein
VVLTLHRAIRAEQNDCNMLDTKEIAQAMTATTQLITTLFGRVAAVSSSRRHRDHEHHAVDYRADWIALDSACHRALEREVLL